MDGGDGWHVARFQSASNKTIINPVMLRFRPIAPKPAAGGSIPGGIRPENTSAVVRTSNRVKRKYVRVRNKDNNSGNPRRRSRNNNNNNNTRSSAVEERESGFNSTTVTLQLMPEKSDGYDFLGSGCNSSTGSLCIIDQYRTALQDNYYYNNNNSGYNNSHPPGGEALDRAAVTVKEADAVVESWVTVESVTDTCMDDARGLGCTDVERIKNLERDTCPGFVSDGCFSKVEWVNEAYKRMVAEVVEEGRRRWPEVAVWLVANNNNNNRINYNNKAIKAELGLMGPAFTCRVRLQYMKVNKEKCSKIMPCDVWKMDCGGFAWRLDVKAALSLGL